MGYHYHYFISEFLSITPGWLVERVPCVRVKMNECAEVVEGRGVCVLVSTPWAYLTCLKRLMVLQ